MTASASGTNRATAQAFGWPLERLGEGMEELARHCRLLPSRRGHPEGISMPSEFPTGSELTRWVEWAGARLGIEAEPVETTVSDFEQFARMAGPAIFVLPGPAGPLFLLVIRATGKHLSVLGPDLKRHRCPAVAAREAICGRFEAPLDAEIDRILALADLRPGERMRTRAALLRERIGPQRLAGFWILRLPPSSGFWRQLVHARLPHRLAGVLGVFAIVYALEILAWGLIGNAALSGRLDFGWMSAWMLLIVTLVPLGLLGSWLNASFAVGAGRLLKRRLLAGALNLDADSVRHQGVGQTLSRVMETQTLENLALNGGLAVLVATLELAFAGGVIWLGAAGRPIAVLLLGWFAVTLWLVLKYVREMRTWTRMRLDMTHGLIERMVGHRTILAQEWPWRRDAHEDRTMSAYADGSRRLDRIGVAVFAGVPGGWGLLGLIGLAPTFAAGGATAADLAITFGGLLLAARAFGGIAMGVSALAGAAIAWDQVGPLFRSGSLVPHTPTAFMTDAPTRNHEDPARAEKVLDASRLVFSHEGQRQPVIDGADLAVYQGERLLLEGPSGGGKSSLASLLVGLRSAQSGLLLLNGLDRPTLGEEWHRKATEAPQFHENHVLNGTLAFNVLMGSNWPADEAEIEEARALLVELGLGDLLDRMPAGMQQMVGETGWQLSHGERSRIFLARALLQKADFTVMDESFAALDPETLQRCLQCVFRRTGALMVIAHP